MGLGQRSRRRAAAKKGTVRQIRTLGDPVLRTECDPVRSFDADLKRLVDDMYASMYAAEGVGLAANQIGVSLRVFVYDCKDDRGRNNVGHMINPTLVAADGDVIEEGEGCLSVPGLYFPTRRQMRAVVEGQDLDGRSITVEGTGYFGRCLQHETDHLNGGVYIDRLEGDARRSAMREVRAADWSRP